MATIYHLSSGLTSGTKTPNNKAEHAIGRFDLRGVNCSGSLTAIVLPGGTVMMTSEELHPLARDVLQAFATQSHFRSLRFSNAIAERNPTQCVRWAFNLVESFVNLSTPHDVISQSLLVIRHSINSPSADQLPHLDDLSWRSWCSGSFDEEAPFAQRAVARLGWASMLLIGNITGRAFESRNTGIHIAANQNGAIREMANQCGMAVDMLYTDTNDGRMMVAASFSREMASL